jgi:tetratricopeptide (TPR) repeat protein
MAKLTLDEAQSALPPLEDLRPVIEHLLAGSRPNPSRAWSGSGRLGTFGSRIVSPEALAGATGRLAREQAARLEQVYAAAARVLQALEREDLGAAAHALLEAAALEERLDRAERAEAYAGAAYRAARGARDQRPAALALRRWARAARALGRLTEALDRYVLAHEAARSLSDGRGAAEAAVGAGNVLEDQGRWREAAEWYRTALEALDGVAGPTPELWHAELCLHIVARSQGAIDESLTWLARAETSAAESDAPAARPFLENARGQVLMARGAYTDAEAHLREGVRTASHARTRASIRLNLAEALLAQGRTLDAAEQAREAEREAIRAALIPKLPEVYRLLGRIASADGDPDAFVLFERALSLAREHALPALEEAQTLQAYAEAEARAGDDATAAELMRQAEERFDALGIPPRRRWADVFGPEIPSLPHEREIDDE